MTFCYLIAQRSVLLPQKNKDAYLNRTPLGRPGKPEEVASAVIFLVSSAGNFITGQAINVCGGYLMA